MSDQRIDRKQELLNHLSDPASVLVIADEFDPDWFDLNTESELRDIVEYQLDHVDKYGDIATDEHLVAEFGSGLKIEKPVTSIDWLIKQFRDRYIAARLRNAIESNVQDIFDDPEKALTELIDDLEKIEQKATRAEIGIKSSDFRYILEEFYEQVDEGGDLPSFGFEEIDNAMGGGMRCGRLYGLVARPKRYKSWNPIAAAVLNQKKGITSVIQQLEMTVEETFYRYACMVTKTPWNDFYENKLDALGREKMINVLAALHAKQVPNLHIMQPPLGQRTARHMRSLTKGVGGDVMFVDYLGFMETQATRSSKEFERVPFLMQELKQATDLFPVYFLHHLNREVDANSMYDMRELGSKIGLSDSILKTSDTVFGIHATPNMLNSGILHLGVIESRTNAPQTWEVAVELTKTSSFRVIGKKGEFDDDDE